MPPITRKPTFLPTREAFWLISTLASCISWRTSVVVFCESSAKSSPMERSSLSCCSLLFSSCIAHLSLLVSQPFGLEGLSSPPKYRQDIIAICLRHDTSDWNRNKTLDCERSNRTPT